MKILITQLVGIGGPLLDVLQTQIETNPTAEIYYLSCSNSFSTCYANPKSNPEICYKCKLGVSKSLKLIEGNFKHLFIEDILNNSDKIKAKNFREENLKITKELKYEDFRVGESTLSTYISKTRDRDIEGLNSHSFANDLIENGVMFYSALDRFFDNNSFDVVYSFNGRDTYNRAVMDIAIKHNVNCYNMEIARPGGYLEKFVNTLPHNIKTRTSIIEDAWSNSDLSLEKKMKIGTEYFRMKLKGEKLNDKIYTENQVSKLLPTEVDYNKKTFVLYTSSDDEFAAVGEEYDNPYFKDQNDGIFYLAKLINEEFKDCNLIIRMHPNLFGVEHKYVQDLRGIKDMYPNVYLVLPESPVDTYALLKIAEKIIVFGSTIGVEANFWGKPVILLGKSFYFRMNIAYKPSTKAEIKKLLISNLEPKDKIDALKFGFYYTEGGIPSKYYTKNQEGITYFKGTNIYEYSWLEHKIAKLIKIVHSSFGVRLFVR